MSNAPQYRFFKEVELPRACLLQELLLWVSAQSLHVAFHTRDGTESRQCFETLYEEHGASGNPFVGSWLEPEETNRLGIDRHPVHVEFFDYLEEDSGIPDVDFLSRMIEQAKSLTTPFENPDESLRQLEAQMPLAIKHDAYKRKWESDFEDAVDYHRALILTKLRDGDLVGRGVSLASEGDEDMDAAWEELAEKQRSIRGEDFSILLSEIAREEWISRRIEWTQSRLQCEKRLYVGVQFLISDVLNVFPPRNDGEVQFSDGGSFVYTDSGATPRGRNTARPGRPTKNWDAVSVYIAEIIQRDGSLPKKQDALAHEICAWYKRKFGGSIGLSTVKSKLSQYYASEIIEKSRK
ncbi:MAG: hypothetical protein AAF830_13705 [Pseudomonadota bacterium]